MQKKGGFKRKFGGGRFGYNDPASLVNSDKLYPPIQVPGQQPGEMPQFNIDEYPQRSEIQAIAKYEKELQEKLRLSTTHLLFDSHGVALEKKEALRR